MALQFLSVVKLPISIYHPSGIFGPPTGSFVDSNTKADLMHREPLKNPSPTIVGGKGPLIKTGKLALVIGSLATGTHGSIGAGGDCQGTWTFGPKHGKSSDVEASSILTQNFFVDAWMAAGGNWETYDPGSATLPDAFVSEHGLSSPTLSLSPGAARIRESADELATHLGVLTMIATDGKPKLAPKAGASAYYLLAPRKFEREGPAYVHGEVSLAIALDTSTLTAVVLPDLGADDGVVGQAYRAQKAWNDQFFSALAKKSDGGAADGIIWPSQTRPEETRKPELPPDVLTDLDQWWATASSVANEARTAPGPSEDDAWARYLAGGGELGREAWSQTRDARIAGVNKEGSGSHVLDKISQGLGWAGNAAMEGFSWLANATKDTIQEWGPTGVVGAYAGVKAVNGLDRSGSNVWPLVILGGIALVLLVR